MQNAWLLLALPKDQRQHEGNTGYDDEISRVYRYDSFVPNSRRLKQGDIVVLRSDVMEGVARIQRIQQKQGTKEFRRCPSCHSTSMKARKTAEPKFRCACGHTTDAPEIDRKPCILFAAHFGDSFVEARGALSIDTLRAACIRYNGQHAMQQLDFGKVAAQFPQIRRLPSNPNKGPRPRAGVTGTRMKGRRFDPTRSPAVPERTHKAADPAVTALAREKAVKGHHAILCDLYSVLRSRGWMDLREDPNSFDLVARCPDDSRRWWFEAKTVTAHNETSQTRSGLAQLLEYRARFGDKNDGLALVTNHELSSQRLDILDALGVVCIVVAGSLLRTLGVVGRDIFGA